MAQQVEALLTEHFRYTPLSLIDDIINTVNTIIYRAIEAIENGLFSIPPQQLGYAPDPPHNASSSNNDDSEMADPEHPDAKDEIENGVHQLETLLEATVDKTFDKFEIYTLRNILTVDAGVASWMRLGHYEGLTFPPSPSASTLTPDSLLTLRRTLQETRKLNLLLRSTHAKNASTISQLRAILSPQTPSSPTPSSQLPSSTEPPDTSLAFLTSHPGAKNLNIKPFDTPASASGGDREPLTERTRFLISQLPALRQALGELKPRLRTLRDKVGDVDWESRREERRRYIEGRVRRVVGGGGGGREAEDIWEGPEKGIKVGREEIRDLEGVVRGFGGGEARMEG